MKGLNAKALGLAGGILWAVAVFILALVAQGGYAAEWIDLLSKAYLGLDTTFVGALIGAVWGFFDAFIGLYIFAWLYNKLV